MITTVEHHAEATHILLTVPGPDLDLAIADELRSRLSTMEADHPAAVVVVDLSAVTFMDCAGLGPLVAARARLGSRLLLRGVGPHVSRLLDLTGLNGLFHQESDPSEATHRQPLSASAQAAEDARPSLISAAPPGQTSAAPRAVGITARTAVGGQ